MECRPAVLYPEAHARQRRTLLLVSRDAAAGLALLPSLRRRGHDITHACCGDSAIAQIRRRRYDVVLIRACAPGRAGLRVLLSGTVLSPGTRFVVLTEDARVETAVEAMRAGAFDYVVEPISADALDERVSRALRARRPGEVGHISPRSDGNGCGLVGDSPQIRAVLHRIDRVAHTVVPVLITGETGVGKELVARAIHDSSPRSHRPFVPVSCAALNEGVVESALFGHRRGSFTGAVASHGGLVREADGGTLFLDEIETLGLGLQAKLLRMVEEKTVQPVGGRHDIPVDFRLIAASNVPLEPLLARGAFRQDLYYRLNVFPIGVPPLRERRGDILTLAEHFRDRFAAETGLPALPFADESVREMLAHDWPGNARELRNSVERAMILAADPDHLRLEPRFSPDGGDPTPFAAALAEGWPLRRLEQEYVAAVLDTVQGNRSRAARLLQINRSTLHEKLSRSSAALADGSSPWTRAPTWRGSSQRADPPTAAAAACD